MSIEHFKKVLCVKSSNDNFKVGDIYARIGDNNGVHVFYVNKIGDPVDVLCHNYDALYPVTSEGTDFETKFEEIESQFHC